MGITIVGGRGDDNAWNHQLLQHVLGVSDIGPGVSNLVKQEIFSAEKLVGMLTDAEKVDFYNVLRLDSVRGNHKYLPGAILRAKNPGAFRSIFLEVKTLVGQI